MKNLFVSYGRKGRQKAEALVKDLQTLGHSVWFDDELTGGHRWWDNILEQVRHCDVFIFVLDNQSVNSTACKHEYSYAAALGKPILPVLVDRSVGTNMLPGELTKVQFVDYTSEDREAALRLARAFASLPDTAPLPDPLPAPPEAPISHLASLADQIEGVAELGFERQTAIVLDLKQALKTGESAEDADRLLRKLRGRRDLYAAVATEIDEILPCVDPDQSVEPTYDAAPTLQNHTIHPEDSSPRNDKRSSSTQLAFYDATIQRIYYAIGCAIVGLLLAEIAMRLIARPPDWHTVLPAAAASWAFSGLFLPPRTERLVPWILGGLVGFGLLVAAIANMDSLRDTVLLSLIFGAPVGSVVAAVARAVRWV